MDPNFKQTRTTNNSKPKTISPNPRPTNRRHPTNKEVNKRIS
jgi:hypothetical protein